MMNRYGIFLLIIMSILLQSCGRKYTEAEKQYISVIEKNRKEKDDYFKNNPESPFNFKGKVHFEPLKYYEVDPSYIFKSKLTEYEQKDTVSVFGTKGEERKALRYSYLKFKIDSKEVKLNVYKSPSGSGGEYYSIWFTDKTTGDETYGVGRYLDFELNADKQHEYLIDFNQAYNPYCAYTKSYSCAIPTKEDHIDASIKAGEKTFH